MKEYRIELIIKEGSDEFWEDIESSGATGCDEILESLSIALRESGFSDGFDTTVILRGYQNQ
jgi:hypothetical protein